MDMFKSKKGFMNHPLMVLFWVFVGLGLVSLVSGVVFTLNASVLDDIGADFTAGSTAADIANESLQNTYALAQKQSTLNTVGYFAIIIGLIVTAVGGLGVYAVAR